MVLLDSTLGRVFIRDMSFIQGVHSSRMITHRSDRLVESVESLVGVVDFTQRSLFERVKKRLNARRESSIVDLEISLYRSGLGRLVTRSLCMQADARVKLYNL